MTDEGKRNKWIKVRVNKAEYDEINGKAVAAGMSVANLIRQSIHRVNTWTIGNIEVEREKIREISRIGQNLNQISRFCNIYKSDTETVQILNSLIGLEKKINSFFLLPHSCDSVNKGDKDAH